MIHTSRDPLETQEYFSSIFQLLPPLCLLPCPSPSTVPRPLSYASFFSILSLPPICQQKKKKKAARGDGRINFVWAD